MQSNKLTSILLYAAIAIFLFGSGYKFGIYNTQAAPNSTTLVNLKMGESFSSSNSNPKDINMNLFWETWNKLEEKYVDKQKLDKKKMYYGAIKGLAASLEDPYTFFLTPEENKQTKDDLGGRFEGIGAQLGLKDNQIVVVAPLKESPAEKAGIRAGDIITAVDGKSTKGWTLLQGVSKIRGPKKTPVKLTIQRGGKTSDYTIIRDEIHIPSVELSYKSKKDCTSSSCPQAAVLKLNQFGEQTNSEWDKAVQTIADKWQKKEISGMVLDLRDNPGGFLESAVYIASEFIPEGKRIVKQESTKASESRDYTVYRDGKLLDIPLVVMINEGSASASEIVAGALRDYNRAKLIGQKSFGKGSVQEAIDLKDNAGLHITIAKWILPKGDWINGKGIEPEIKVQNPAVDENDTEEPADEQLEKAIDSVVK